MTLRGGIISETDIPNGISKILGKTHGERINTLVVNLIENNLKPDHEIENAATELRNFMFEKVYIDSAAKAEEKKAENIIEQLYNYFICNPLMMPQNEIKLLEKSDINRVVCDYIAGMSDSYAVQRFCDLFLPHPWTIK